MGGSPGEARLRTAVVGLVVVLICCGALGIAGLGVEDRLEPTSLIVPGTNSARGQALAEEHFGDSSPFAVLLRGPRGAIERQGPALVRALRRNPRLTAISPWDRGSVAYLRPGPGRAIILLDYHLPLDVAMRDTVPALERTLEERVHPPLEAIQSGYASVSRALQKESLRATERAELIAAPLLLIVLLLVFRSLDGGRDPAGLRRAHRLRRPRHPRPPRLGDDDRSPLGGRLHDDGPGARGRLLAVHRLPLPRRAGGWSLAMAGGAGPRGARRAAPRVFAGATLFTSILLSSFLQPGSLLLSLATALVVVTPISVAIAWIALPALLALLGERINMGAIGKRAPAGGRSRVAAMADSALRRPAMAAALIAVPLLLLAAPALAFNTGAPGVNELPKSSPARQSAEAIDRAVGPGWEAPFEIVVAARQGPITTQHRLALLVRAQRRIAARPEVRAVIGPAPIQRAVRPLRGLGSALRPMGPPAPPSSPTSVPACAAPPPPWPGCGPASRAPRVAAACSVRAPNGPVPVPACWPADSNAPPPAGPAPAMRWDGSRPAPAGWRPANEKRRMPAWPWKSNFTPWFPVSETRRCDEHAVSPTNWKRRLGATHR